MIRTREKEKLMKVNKIKIFLVLLVILSIIGGIIYFVYANNQEEKPEDIQVKYETVNMITDIRFGVSSFDSINPHITQNKDIIQIDSLIFEPLLEIMQDYKITACLAEECSKVSEKSYVIKLKENVTWQDGTDFTAEDVKFTIETIQENKNSIYLENVKDINKVEIVDTYTLRLELNERISFFEYQLIFPILSKKQYENQDMEKSAEIPLGTGKYKITKLENDVIELTKDEEWHEIENENSNIKTITIYIYETAGDVYNSFRQGNIDLIHTNNINYEEYIGSMGYQKKQYTGREYDYLALNCENAVLQYKEVRQAIQKVINKEKIVSSILENCAYVANFPLDYGSYLMENLELSVNSSQEEATKILKDAGWEYEYGIWSKEIDGRTRTLNFNFIVNEENEQRVKVAEEIKSQLEDFGIEITIQKLTNSNYQRVLENQEYEIILTGVYNSYSPELNSFFGENNLANYKNEEFQSLLKQVDEMSSEELQKETYKRIVEIYKEEVPYIGLYRNKVTVAYGQNVMGDITPNNYSIFYQFSDWYRQ